MGYAARECGEPNRTALTVSAEAEAFHSKRTMCTTVIFVGQSIMKCDYSRSKGVYERIIVISVLDDYIVIIMILA